MSPDLYSGGRQERTMSEVSGPTSGGMSGNRPPLHQSGLVYDYFGPDPVAGPYTEDADSPWPERGSLNRTPSRGVPAVPRGPGDISRPVEIGESAASSAQRGFSLGFGGVVEPKSLAVEGTHSYTTTPDGAEGHYPPPRATQQQQQNITGDQPLPGVAGSGTAATTDAASTNPPPSTYDPHHVQIHEMDPQREGPFELPGLHTHNATVGGPFRSFEDQDATHPAAERDSRR
ncbi:hypothetical protein Micbo1qcDRAFT_163874 [Microdochium bolleyi]|uniref:Uncharacterized protein n=1 Tax=Microdochium bolleyi TaxID=196109 RepID=A0A136J1U5_9PEZI|nr:hypothetical protein Micbo1qcDRAFT_163874 [Microdochium bolleyi]